MYKTSDLLGYVYFDIETSPISNSFEELPKGLQKIWLDKIHHKALEKETELRRKRGITDSISVNDLFIKESGLHAEFAKVYCISFGFFTPTFEKIVATFCEKTEKETILNFLTILQKYKTHNLAGFNIAEFDIPFLLKRMWVNQILDNYPPQLQLKGAKPWTVNHEDCMLTYKAGSWSSVSLALLCEVFGIKSPKVNFNNDEFTTLLTKGEITKEQAIEYCEGDVVALMDLMKKTSSENSNFDKSNTFSYTTRGVKTKTESK